MENPLIGKTITTTDGERGVCAAIGIDSMETESGPLVYSVLLLVMEDGRMEMVYPRGAKVVE